jgi:hypothetical protein
VAIIGLDGAVYKNIFTHPLAVGYWRASEYFFRGRFATCLPVLYKNSISSVRLRLRILSTQEAMKMIFGLPTVIHQRGG